MNKPPSPPPHGGFEGGFHLSETSTSYCTTQDVYNQFPVFVPNQTGNVSDSVVQYWIDDAGAYIYALFLSRGINLTSIQATTGLTPVQLYILRMLNRESGTKDLAAVIRYSNTSADMGAFGAQQDQPKTSLVANRFRDGRFSEILRGSFDKVFLPNIARTTSISPTIPGSISGGDTEPGLTAQQEGLNSFFVKSEQW